MTTPVRLGAFLAVLLVLLVAGLGLGRAVGPLDTEPARHGASAGDHAVHDAGAATAVTGLQASEDGYRLVLATDRARPGRQPVSFTVTGPDGGPVTAYDVRHEKDLHLVVVRRDLTGFQHVHPVLDEETGLWTAEVDLTPGAWRVLADFDPSDGDPLVLGADLLVSGSFEPEPVGAQQLAASVDGYDVTLGGALSAGTATRLTLTVSRAGEPVRDLEPYLGAYGHLVALRAEDLAYLHVHPEESASGPAIPFTTELPSAGRYRLFLDFQHDGVVRTAAFTVVVDDATGADGHEQEHDHQEQEGGSHEH